MPTIIWNVPTAERRISAHMSWKSATTWRRATPSRPVPLASTASWMSTPEPRATVVATAAPVTPSSGNGPQPKMRKGSSRRLIAFAVQRTRIAIVASPAPRNAALMRKRRITVASPPRMMRAYPVPAAITSGVAPMRPSRCGAKRNPDVPRTLATASPSRTACTVTRAAASWFFSPMRRDTIAVTPMLSPIASA